MARKCSVTCPRRPLDLGLKPRSTRSIGLSGRFYWTLVPYRHARAMPTIGVVSYEAGKRCRDVVGDSKGERMSRAVIRRIAFACAFAGLVAAAPVQAQDTRVEIGGGAGWTLSDGVTFSGVIAGDGNV